MSDVILKWLNKEVKIPRKVRHIESDFANGVLFAEVFRKLKPEIDISAYSEQVSLTGSKNIVANYKLLQPLFDQYKIQYDNDLLRNIIMEERGAALKLLFQLRQILEKAKPRIGKQGTLAQKTKEINENIGTGATGRLQHYGQKLVADQAGLTMRDIVEKKGTDRKLMQRLAPYSEEQIRQMTKALNDQRKEERAHSAYLQQQRLSHLNVMKRNQALMAEWEAKNIENWKKSMRDKKEMLARIKFFRELEVEKHKTSIRRIIKEASQEMTDGIDAFEKNLARQGIDINARRDGEGPQGPPPPIDFATLNRVNIRHMQPTQMLGHFSAVATMNKIREKKNANDIARKERDKLRTKLQLEQDRAKANLEANKKEQALVEKFIASMGAQKSQNFDAWRKGYNKTVEDKNRADVAIQREKELHKAISDIQAAQKEYFKEEEKRRKVEYKHKKLEYREINLERKAEKRAAHGVVCKEITRSILDIALAVFDSREEQLEAARQEIGENFIYEEPPVMTPNWRDQKIKMSEAGKIDVKKWREWIAQFVEGKGVFDDDDDDLTPPPILPQKDQSHSQEVVGLSKDATGLEGLVAANAVDQVEFVDYMRGLGLWEEKGLLAGDKELANMDWNSFITLQHSFGDIIQEIIEWQFSEDKKEREKLAEQSRAELPMSEMTVKLCINGPIFTGKSAHSQSLKQKYPELLVLEAEQVLKEALIISDPVRKEEEANIDPKKKKEPPKKGQQEDAYTLLTQEYEGTEFYRLSARVREDIIRERETARLNKSGHLVGMSLDKSQEGDDKQAGVLKLNEAWKLITPQNMVKLLVCRIKLNSEKYKKTEEEKEEEMRKQIIREREINQELAKLAEEAAALANDPKAKKPAPGKPGTKSPEQLLKQELEEIRTPPLNGWIIVGYPNTQEEATVLFEKLSGFRQTAQQGERSLQLYTHSAASLAPSSKTLEGSKKELQFPGCDVMISLLGSTSESIRRFEGRKVDPATGTIYHMQDNPPPPNIAVDKLQEVQEEDGALPHSPEVISRSFENWEAGFRYFEKWMRQFGIEGYLRTHFVQNGGQGPSTKIEVPRARVFSIVDQLIKVKADMLEKEKQKLRNKMAQEPTPDEEGESPEIEQSAEKQQSVEPTDASQNVTPLPEEEKFSDKRSVSKPSYSRLTGRPRTRAESKTYLFACWNELAELYISTIRSQLQKLANQQVTVMNGMTTIQQRFAQFLVRPDNKQALLDEFIDSFQNLAHANPGWEANPAIHAQLNQMIEKTGDELWDVIERRKDEAEEERAKIIQTGWVKKQIVKMVKTYHRLANLEFMKFRVSLGILKQHFSELSEDIDVEETELVSKLETINLFNPQQQDQIMGGALKEYEMPKVEAINFALNHRVDSLYNALITNPLNESMELKNIESYHTIASNLRRAVKYRGSILRAWFIRETIEIMQMSASIYHRMDDWIVTAVFGENKMIGAAIKNIKRLISQGTTEVPTQTVVGPVSINSFQITPLDAAGLSSRRSSGLLPKLGSQVGAFLLGGFSTQQLRILIDALERAAEDNLYITRRRAFKFFLSLSKEDPNENGITALPDAWRGFSSMMFRVLIRSLDPENKGYFEWRHLASYFCLLKSSLPLAMELNYYRNALRENSIQIKQPVPAEGEQEEGPPTINAPQVGREEMYINLQKFLETGAWFDENEKDEKDPNRLAEIKWMLFEINKEAQVEYEEDRLHIDEFLKVVCGTDYQRDEKKGEDSLRQHSYYELLFDMK